MEIKCKNCLQIYDDANLSNCPFCGFRNVPLSFDGVSIREFFSENKFNKFVTYCNEHEIKILKDLNDFDFNLLSDVQGIGRGKIEAIQEKYNSITSLSFDDYYEKTSHNNKMLFPFINEQFFNMNISILSAFGISDLQISKLQHNNYKTIGSLLMLDEVILKKLVGKNIDKFYDVQFYLQFGLIDVIKAILQKSKDSKEKDYNCCLLRSEGHSLQEIGDKYFLTRERVRQIVSNFLSKIDPLLKQLFFDLLEGKRYVYGLKIKECFNEKSFSKILIYAYKNSEYATYLDFCDTFVTSDFDIEKLLTTLSFYSEEFAGEGVKLSEHTSDLETIVEKIGLDFINSNTFIDYMLENGFVRYGDYMMKYVKSYGFLCAKIIGEKFPNGFRPADHNDLELLRKYARKRYGNIGVSKNDHALATRVTNYLVLIGRGLYTTADHIEVDMALLNKLTDYIDSQPLDSIYYSELYLRFENEIKESSNITNHYFLHGVLKLYFSDRYDFSNRDYLSKKGTKSGSGNITERLEKILAEHKKPMTRKEISEALPGVTWIMLMRMIANSSVLLQWDFSEYSSLKNIDYTEQDKQLLKELIQSILVANKGCCSDKMLHSLTCDKYPELLDHLKITNAYILFNFCAKILSDCFDFRKPIITEKNLLSVITTKNVVLKLLGNPNDFYFSDFTKVTNLLQLSDVSTSSVYIDLRKDYIRLNQDHYLRKDKILLRKEQLDLIENILKEKLNKGYISLMKFDISCLPIIKYDWNAFLLHDIVERYIPALCIVQPKMTDRRTERGIIVSDETITSYDVLIVQILKSKGIHEISEYDMLHFLTANGLAYKSIPHDLYVSDLLEFKDNLFEIL